MQLLNPQRHTRPYRDDASRTLMRKTIEFFERSGHAKLREHWHAKRWYDDFLAHVKEHKLFATILTPKGYGPADSRWDTWRNCEFAEILGFYGLEYWYTWQVSMLGVGPIWQSQNEALKQRLASQLQEGCIFGFGLSEKDHGADIYSSEVNLKRTGEGAYVANGRKYYIGNGNKAAIVSTFGKLSDTGEYVFFAVDSRKPQYACVQGVTVSQSYVSEFSLNDYPIREEDIIAKGPAAWDAALNTINFCKYNLGWAAIGICTHAFYEAITHASGRRLYNMAVTDFPHVQQLFVDAYTRLLAMKGFSLRAADYMRSASASDRRYLLFNPMVKMKVTTQGEQVMNLMWDIIAAKGFEKDMYFQEASVSIRGLPKLEGTVHVNIALIVKFMANYFFNPQEFAPVPVRDDVQDDTFLFGQGTTKGLGDIRFPAYDAAYAGWSLPNVKLFLQQVNGLRDMLAKAPPSDAQRKDTGWLLALGEMFALVVYAQLILEHAKLEKSPDDLVQQIFDFLVRDMSTLAADFHGRSSTSDPQAASSLKLIQRPTNDAARFGRIWEQVHGQAGAYTPAP